MSATLRALLKGLSPEGHPGLLLDYGVMDPAEVGAKSELLKRVIDAAGKTGGSELYCLAYRRWKTYAVEFCSTAELELRDRMHIGMGVPSVLETNVTLHSTYGVPMIPGDTLKGALRAYAEARVRKADINPDAYASWSTDLNTLFGKVDQAGAIVVHDAWWIPHSSGSPLCLEVETPHHPQYYSSGGKTPATDYDDPIPISQLAVQGSFLIAIDSTQIGKQWADFARDLLHTAIAETGIGGRVNAGYGHFTVNARRDAQ